VSQIFAENQLIADRFRIVRFIAEGGMGEVYEAEDQVLGDRVALKFLNRRNVGDEQVARRFRREIQLARKVTHPNVCRIFDVYRHRLEDGVLAGSEVTFVTMELLAGETLEQALLRGGPMREQQAFPIVAQMAAALGAAHAAGIIHRDFKSSNVMLIPAEEGGPRVVVTDFGLARAIGRSDSGTTPLTGEMKVLGTPDYMSPEQLRGQPVSAASDIYALGVVMFEMLTGDKPYQADTTMTLLVKRISEPPRSPRELVPQLDERWERAILRCLADDPAARFGTVQEVVGALGDGYGTGGWAALPGTAGSGTGTGATVVPAAPAGSPARWLLPAAGVLLVIALLILWQARRELPRPPVFSPSQLTTGEGLELDPAFSPDGRALAYSAYQDGGFALFVRQLEPGGRTLRLTEAGQAFEPSFSPDGRWIAYHDAERGGIWRVPAAGGPAERLTDFGSRPTFSPDGRTLAFQSESWPAIADTALPALAGSQLWLVELDGLPWPLTTAGHPPGGHGSPAFSPDGQRLAFTASQRGRSEIWSIARDGSDLVAVVREPASGYDPIYAPDGASIYFSARTRQVSALWRVPVTRDGSPSGPPEAVANLGLASIRQLAIAADGRMAYAGLVTRSNLWSLALEPATALPAAAPQALTTGGGRNNRPAFSPDGRLLAFDRWRLGVNADIWVMTAAGGAARQVTTDPHNNSIASWFPLADRIAFVSERDGEQGLWAIRLATGEETKLADLPPDADWARLAPGGGRVAYHAQAGGEGINVFVLDLTSGARRQLTFEDELAGFPVWSPDGRILAYQSKRGDDSHVMVIPAAGGSPEQLTFDRGQSWPFSFSPDGDKVAFAGEREGRWELYWVSRSSGESRRLTELARLGAYVRYPAWSPDGGQLVFELAETVGDIWLVEGLR